MPPKSDENNTTNSKRKQVGVDGPPFPVSHPREGAAALPLEQDCPPQASPTIAEEPKRKHIWEGHDKLCFGDGSWMFSMNRPNWLNALLAGGLACFGGCEALLFLKIGVINPAAISSQFVFNKFIVLKLFFSIIGSSMIFQSAFDYLCPSFFAETRSVRYSKNGFKKSLLAGALVGVGTVLAGCGPTIAPIFIGGGVPNSIYILLGFLAGGFIYRVMDDKGLAGAHGCVDEDRDKMSIDEKYNIRYWKVAVPVGAALMAAGALFEFVIPGTTTADDARGLGLNPALTFPAIAAGTWVGLGQLPLRLIAHHGQGGSHAIMNLVSFITGGKVAPGSYPNTWGNIYQVAYVWIGMTGFSYVFRTYFNDTIQYTPTTVTFSPARYFIGGALSVIGAKLGAGCVCGQMSACSEFGVEQIVQTLGMFIAGIPFAAVLYANGLLF